MGSRLERYPLPPYPSPYAGRGVGVGVGSAERPYPLPPYPPGGSAADRLPPMPYLLLQRCSKRGKHRAPACRHGARRAFGHLPLPRFRHLLLDVATTRCCATDIVRRRERSLAATRILCPRPPMTQFGATIGSNPGPAAPSQRSQAWPWDTKVVRRGNRLWTCGTTRSYLYMYMYLGWSYISPGRALPVRGKNPRDVGSVVPNGHARGCSNPLERAPSLLGDGCVTEIRDPRCTSGCAHTACGSG